MGTNEMTAMRPFLLRRREIPCLCWLVREVLRERFGDEAGRFRVVFSEGVDVIGGASGCLITWRWTLRAQRRGGRVSASSGGRGVAQECSLVSRKIMNLFSLSILYSCCWIGLSSSALILYRAA